MTVSAITVEKLRKDVSRAKPETRSATWSPTVTRGSALLEKTMPDISFLCAPWIPEGVMILAGRPKLGKTSIARQWAVMSSNGGSLWGKPCRRAGALVLSLEEGEKLMKRKLLAAGYTAAELVDVHMAFTWRQGILGVGDLQAYLETEPGISLVIIDSLTRFRDSPTKDKPAFQQDYEAVSQLTELAKTIPGLAIVVVHHTVKATNQGDPISDISGTFGLSAAADSYAVLRKEGSDFVLHCGGRYWDEPADAFALVRDLGRWNMAGAHDAVQLSPMQKAYLAALAEAGTVTTQGMATRFGVGRSTASELLSELADKGVAERQADGWRATESGLAKATQLHNVTNKPNVPKDTNIPNIPNIPNVEEGSCSECSDVRIEGNR